MLVYKYEIGKKTYLRKEVKLSGNALEFVADRVRGDREK